MSNIPFHTVDPQTLNIPLETILATSNAALKNAVYDIPVPTEDQTLPHRVVIGRNSSLIVGDKLHRSKPNLIDQYRGRLGGC